MTTPPQSPPRQPSFAASRKNTAAPEKHDEKVVALEALLTALTVQHEKLIALAEQHKAAIMAADVPAMHAAISLQTEAVQKVAELERARETLVIAMGFGSRSSHAAQPVTLSAIAATLNEPARSRLGGAAQKLRSLIEQLRQDQKTLQAAAESVAMHLDGIMTQVAQRLSTAGTYARGGVIDRYRPMATSIDLRS